MKKLVIFDLDGTLLNTLGGIASACNRMLDVYGYDKWGEESYKKFIGNGTRKLIERVLPECKSTDDCFVNEAKDRYLEIYRDNLTVNTQPYSEISQLLAYLNEKGIMAAVASNKFDDGTKHLIEYFFHDVKFAAVEGQKEGIPVKPNPYIVYDIMTRTRVAADDILYVGDTGIDMQTAANAGVESVGVTWGFRSKDELETNGAAHVVNHPMEIVSLLDL